MFYLYHVLSYSLLLVKKNEYQALLLVEETCDEYTKLNPLLKQNYISNWTGFFITVYCNYSGTRFKVSFLIVLMFSFNKGWE